MMICPICQKGELRNFGFLMCSICKKLWLQEWEFLASVKAAGLAYYFVGHLNGEIVIYDPKIETHEFIEQNEALMKNLWNCERGNKRRKMGNFIRMLKRISHLIWYIVYFPILFLWYFSAVFGAFIVLGVVSAFELDGRWYLLLLLWPVLLWSMLKYMGGGGGMYYGQGT